MAAVVKRNDDAVSILAEWVVGLWVLIKSGEVDHKTRLAPTGCV